MKMLLRQRPLRAKARRAAELPLICGDRARLDKFPVRPPKRGPMPLGLSDGIVEYRAQRLPRLHAAAQRDPSEPFVVSQSVRQGRATVADTRPQPDEERAAPPPLLL